MFVEDRDRVKSFSWEGRSGKPVHTLNSLKHKGPLVILPNGRILRGGVGSVLLWRLDELETHGDGPDFKRIGKGKYNWENSMRDLASDDDEEYSTGSRPAGGIKFTDPNFAPRHWQFHKPSKKLLTADSDCGSGLVDMQKGFTFATRFLGHGGPVCDFSVSDGDPNTFLTAAGDGYARLFDYRQSMPVLTLDAEKREAPLISAVYAHVDGLPGAFKLCKVGGE